MRTWLACLGIALLIAGCANTAHYPINPRLERQEMSAGWRIQRVKADPDNPGDVLVIVTFSGGGTRAAALAYGTLEAMREVSMETGGRQRRLLDEIDIINAVSGGAAVAAYYALHRERLFTDFEPRFLRHDIESELKKSLVGNLGRLASPRFGRSDLVAEYLDRELYDGRTYADLVRGSYRPFVVINATDLSTGARFPFTQSQFDLLCSDLGGVSLGRAVAASMALPPYFSAITLWNYAGDCAATPLPGLAAAFRDKSPERLHVARAREAISYLDRKRRPYVHLVDGGLIDNLGVRAPIDFAVEIGGFYELAETLGYEDLVGVVFVSVNAETDPDLRADLSPNVPTLWQLFRALELPVNAHSFETAERLRASFAGWRADVHRRRALASEHVTNSATTRRISHGADTERAFKSSNTPRTSTGPQTPRAFNDPDKPRIFDGITDTPRFYFIDVSLRAIEDQSERDYFMSIPTTLALDDETVDRLRAVARRLFLESSDLKRLLRDQQARPDAMTKE